MNLVNALSYEGQLLEHVVAVATCGSRCVYMSGCAAAAPQKACRTAHNRLPLEVDILTDSEVQGSRAFAQGNRPLT